MRETGLEAERVSSIPTGIDLAHFAPADRRAACARLGLPLNAFVIGIVATLRSWKGHRYLVDAVAGARDPDWRLVGAIGEIVRDGETGLMVEPQNADALREALERLNQDPALRERLAHKGYEFARSGFALERMLERMEAVFSSVAAGPETR